MSKKLFSCIIIRDNALPVTIDFQVKSQELAETVYSLFEKYLDEQKYALALVDTRAQLLSEKFQKQYVFKTARKLKQEHPLYLYRGDNLLCTLRCNDAIEQNVLVTIIKSYCKKYRILRREV